MRMPSLLWIALASSSCVLSHSIAVTPNTLPIPPDAVATKQVSTKGCTMFVFGFLPVSGQSNGGLEPHSAYDLMQDVSGGVPMAGVTIEEWQRLWLPIGLSHCTHINGRLMEEPRAGRRKKDEEADDDGE